MYITWLSICARSCVCITGWSYSCTLTHVHSYALSSLIRDESFSNSPEYTSEFRSAVDEDLRKFSFFIVFVFFFDFFLLLLFLPLLTYFPFARKLSPIPIWIHCYVHWNEWGLEACGYCRWVALVTLNNSSIGNSTWNYFLLNQTLTKIMAIEIVENSDYYVSNTERLHKLVFVSIWIYRLTREKCMKAITIFNALKVHRDHKNQHLFFYFCID